MGVLAKIPILQLLVMVSTNIAVARSVSPGTIALALSIVATGLLALRGVSETDRRGRRDNE